MAWTAIDGRGVDVAGFGAHVAALRWSGWRPSRIVLHNTAAPTLAQRPAGFQPAHMRNLETWYRDTCGWSAGPHLFVDDRAIWLFTPLTARGVHSPSWNGSAIGVEMLGDYARERFDEGRGLQVRRHAVGACAILMARLGIAAETLLLHREDPRTTHRGCPGPNVDKDGMIREIAAWMAGAAFRAAA